MSPLKPTRPQKSSGSNVDQNGKERTFWTFVLIGTVAYVFILHGLVTSMLRNAFGVDSFAVPLVGALVYYAPYILILVAAVRLIGLHSKVRSAPGASSKRTNVLDALLLLVVAGWLAIGLIFVMTYVMCAGKGAGCGDVFLLAMGPILALVPLSIVYLVWAIVHVIFGIIKKRAIKKKHVLGAVVTLGLSFLPYIGPMSLVTMSAQTYLRPIMEKAEYEKNGGPSVESKAKVKLGTMTEAQALIDGCNVSSIRYWRYDRRGPWEPKNMYLIVNARNNGTVAYERAPADVKLPFADEEAILAAVERKNDNLTGPYPACEKVINIYKGGYKK